MPRTFCIRCGATIPTGTGGYCKRHARGGASKGTPGGARNGSTRGWRKLRPLVLARDGYRCTHRDPHGRRCEYVEPPGTVTPSRLHVDHITPRARGGTDDLANLATLCRTHNLRKGAR
jgi:5-methylcytosine-specific restriction enzyme A